MEVFIAIVIIGIAVVVIIVVIDGGKKPTSSRVSPSSLMRPTRQRIQQHSDEPFPIEALIGLLVLGGLSLAAIRFIQSGGLKKLLNEIGKIPIDVDGQSMDIATALRDDAFVRDILQEVLMKKVNEASRTDQGFQSLSENAPKAATDVAQMLRDALDARMGRAGFRS